MYETYKLSPESIIVVRKKMIRNFFFLMVSILLIMLLVPYFGNPTRPFDLKSGAIIVMVFILSGTWGIYNVNKSTKALHDSYCFTITDQWVQREQYNVPSIRIPLENIQSITHHKNGGFTIKGVGKFDYIGISKFVEPYAQLEQSLLQIKAFSDFTPAANLMVKFQVGLSLLVAGLGLVVFMASNKWLVGISGALLSAYFVWYFTEKWRNKNLDKSIRKYRISYILLFIMVLLVMVMKLTA